MQQERCGRSRLCVSAITPTFAKSLTPTFLAPKKRITAFGLLLYFFSFPCHEIGVRRLGPPEGHGDVPYHWRLVLVACPLHSLPNHLRFPLSQCSLVSVYSPTECKYHASWRETVQHPHGHAMWYSRNRLRTGPSHQSRSPRSSQQLGNHLRGLDAECRHRHGPCARDGSGAGAATDNRASGSPAPADAPRGHAVVSRAGDHHSGGRRVVLSWCRNTTPSPWTCGRSAASS